MTYSDPRNLEMPPGTGLAGPGDGGPEIRDLLRRLWGYKWLIAAVMVLVVGSTWLVVEQIVPRYTATAVLLIAPPERNVIELKDVVERLDTNPQTIRSEAIVLESRDLSAKAVEKLGLFDSTRLNSPRNRKSFFAHLNPLTYLPKEWREGFLEFLRDAEASALGNPPPVNVPNDGDPEQARRDAIVSQFMAGLSVSREEFTRVIRISFTFENPKLAADAANALADGYVQNTLDVKYAGTREAAVWLREQLNTLRLQVEESEAALERVRQGEARAEGRSTNLASDEITALNNELVKAKSETTRLRARLQQIEELRKSSDWAAQSATIFRSDMIQTLRLEQFKLEREEADLSIDLGDDHPRMINIRAEIASVEAKLQRELEQFVEAARDELVEAQARETALKRNLDSMTNQVGDLNEAEMRMRALEREAQANRNLYEAFLARYKETSIQGEVQQPDARVIGYAQVTNVPSYPPKKRYMNTAIVLSLGLALALVFALEKLDNGFRTARQVEQQTGLPVLGLIPWTKLSREHAKHAEDLITKNSHTRFTESINILYSRLKWPREGGIQNIILVTSAMPKEGKTSTAI
ncbi:MAG TPA: GumC family protein, partial [Rhodothermia bacterium]